MSDSRPPMLPQSSRSSRISLPHFTVTDDSRRAWRKAAYYVPFTRWITTYSLSAFYHDVLAGATVASLIIPQSISYAASLAKLSPVSGLFCASIPGLVYALLGTGAQMNVGPDASVSLLMGQAISEVHRRFANSAPEKAELQANATATAIALQVGLIAFLFGLFRLGFIDVLLSRALLRGFLTAMASIMLIEQTIPMLGLSALAKEAHLETTWDKIHFIISRAPSDTHKMTAVISLTVLLILIVLRLAKNRWRRLERLPDVLLTVVIATILSNKYSWDKAGVDILGSISAPTGASLFQNPFKHTSLKQLKETTSTAALIVAVGFLDSNIASKQTTSRGGISPNRELIALGLANVAVSLIPGTLPGFGSATRSKVNAQVGAKSQISSIVCSTIVLFTTFYLLPYLYSLPKCVLAPIICVIAYSLLEEAPRDVAYYTKMRSYSDLALMTFTFFFSALWDMEYGIMASFIVSLLFVVQRSSKIRIDVLSRVPGTDEFVAIHTNEDGEDEEAKGVLIVKIKESLDFANTSQLKERLRRIELYGTERRHPSDDPSREEPTVIILQMSDVRMCDASAIQILEELIQEHRDRNIRLFVTNLAPQPRVMFTKSGLLNKLGPDAVRASVRDVMDDL